jgi:hypothetical protein
MREISPAHSVTVEEFLGYFPQEFRVIVESIRAQKLAKTRPAPSSSLIDKSAIANEALRSELLDRVAALVDENLAGRSEMCKQFALLLARALAELGHPARAVVGEATYFNEGKKLFSWRHAWVRIGDEVIDGNVDILFENPMIPKSVSVRPYWGLASAIPSDRRLRQDHSSRVTEDTDVSEIWWPELEVWLSQCQI